MENKYSKYFEDNAVVTAEWAKTYAKENNIHFRKIQDNGFMIRLNSGYHEAYFGAGAIYAFTKKGKKRTYRGVIHPKLAWASFITIVCLTHEFFNDSEVSL